MNENERYRSGAAGDIASSSSERSPFGASVGGEEPGGAETGSTSDALKSEAKALGVQAQHVAEDQADKLKEATASHLDGFADALRAASDELSKNQTGPAADFIANAASGLEGFSRSLHGRSTGEMVETVRQFGRDNPMGFLAGSVLAGLALGRFASASMPTASAPSSSTDRAENSRPAGGTSSLGNEGNTP